MSQTSAEQVTLMAEALVVNAQSDALRMFPDEGEYDAFLTGVEWGGRAAIRFLAQAIFDQVTIDMPEMSE